MRLGVAVYCLNSTSLYTHPFVISLLAFIVLLPVVLPSLILDMTVLSLCLNEGYVNLLL